MRARALASILLALGLIAWAHVARADCAAPPASCFCITAAAVTDGHVEAISGDRISVRVDSVTPSATPSAAPPQVGSLAEISTSDLYGLVPKLGDRILTAYDSSGQVIVPAHVVVAEGQVNCPGAAVSLDVAQTAALMVMEASACQAEVDQRFGEYHCDDTRTTCAAGPAQSAGCGVVPLAFAAALLLRLGRRARCVR